MDFKLTKKQWKFITSECDEVLFGGAAGGGKSYAQLIDALLFALKYQGSQQLILRRTFPELKRSLILTALLIYPRTIGKYNSSDHIWRFNNGSLIEFGHCESESDVTKYQSAEYDILRFDELTHFTLYQYTFLLSRVRGVNNYPKQIKSTTNPGNIGHNWVKERFINQGEHNKMFYDKYKHSFIFIPASVYDNKFLLESDPDYIERLKQLPENERKALLEGDWDLFSGQYFSEFRQDIHGIEAFKIPNYWRRFVSLDWGYNDPCAVLWHAIDDGHVYTYRELYIREKTAYNVAKKIIELSQGEEIDYFVASPDMWQKRGADSVYGENMADAFREAGINLFKADNARVIGWQRIREYMCLAPDNKPYWCFFKKACPNLARTLPALIYDKNNPEDAAQGEDHAPEALRYGLMSRPRPKPKHKNSNLEPWQKMFRPLKEITSPNNNKNNIINWDN